MFLPLGMRLITALAILICSLHFSAAAQTKVYLVPVLHSMHKTNFNYNYDSVKAIVARTGADVIAVEIRPEDVGRDSNYLKRNYPLEMWMAPHWFAQKEIEGFDWLGSDIEGRPIPEGYWQTGSEPKRLQAQLGSDSVYSARLKSCQLYTAERLKVLTALSLREILASNDAILTKEYYNCLEQHLRGSDYEALTQFYTLRNQKMMQNLDKLLQKHGGKTLAVLTGADHYPYLLDHLKKRNITVAKLY